MSIKNLLQQTVVSNSPLMAVTPTNRRLVARGPVNASSVPLLICISPLANDELSGLIATMMGMDALIILSNIDGIYNGNPADPASTVIREIDGGKQMLLQYLC